MKLRSSLYLFVSDKMAQIWLLVCVTVLQTVWAYREDFSLPVYARKPSPQDLFKDAMIGGEKLKHSRDTFESLGSMLAYSGGSTNKRGALRRDDGGSVCESVCTHCRNALNLRWAALCHVQCKQGGRAYDACLTIYGMRTGSKYD